jgi:hypothetical protein
MLLRQGFFERLLKKEVEFPSCPASDLVAAQADIRHLTLPQLLHIRCENIECQVSTHAQVQSKFLACIDERIEQCILQKLSCTPNIVPTKGNELVHLALLIYGVYGDYIAKNENGNRIGTWLVRLESFSAVIRLASCELLPLDGAEGPSYWHKNLSKASSAVSKTKKRLHWNVELTYDIASIPLELQPSRRRKTLNHGSNPSPSKAEAASPQSGSLDLPLQSCVDMLLDGNVEGHVPEMQVGNQSRPEFSKDLASAPCDTAVVSTIGESTSTVDETCVCRHDSLRGASQVETAEVHCSDVTSEASYLHDNENVFQLPDVHLESHIPDAQAENSLRVCQSDSPRDVSQVETSEEHCSGVTSTICSSPCSPAQIRTDEMQGENPWRAEAEAPQNVSLGSPSHGEVNILHGSDNGSHPPDEHLEYHIREMQAGNESRADPLASQGDSLHDVSQVPTSEVCWSDVTSAVGSLYGNDDGPNLLSDHRESQIAELRVENELHVCPSDSPRDILQVEASEACDSGITSTTCSSPRSSSLAQAEEIQGDNNEPRNALVDPIYVADLEQELQRLRMKLAVSEEARKSLEGQLRTSSDIVGLPDRALPPACVSIFDISDGDTPETNSELGDIFECRGTGQLFNCSKESKQLARGKTKASRGFLKKIKSSLYAGKSRSKS